ncbi:MAG: type II secretion system F family protein [Candidatus Micrarchaeota archaeon]
MTGREVKENWFTEKYHELELYYESTGFRFSLPVFVAMMLAVSLVSFVALMFILGDFVISVIALLAVFSLIISIPIASRNNRIDEIEIALPDALKHMALVLKAGGTTESALDEVSNADYGPLSVELGRALKKLRGGQSFDDVLIEAAEHSGSLLFRRTVLIIIDAKRSGAGLADVMFAIAEDARDVLHIKRERKSRTVMHVLFLIVSGIILSPFIFGFAISIVNYISVGVASAVKGVAAPACWPGQGALCWLHLPLTICDLNLVLILFLVITAILTSITLGIIREGRAQKFLLYTPIMILVSLLVYEIGKFGSNFIVQAQGIKCSAKFIITEPSPTTLLFFVICLIVIISILIAITRPRRVIDK